MPTPCYVDITGVIQGRITKGAGSVESVADGVVEGHEDEMLVQSVTHNVSVPTNPQSGQPSGQRRHGSLLLTIALNKAVPLLYNALTQREKLSELKLMWYRTSIEGKQEVFFETRLTNAIITDIGLHMPHCQDPRCTEYTQLLNICFSYRRIDWNHLCGGTSGADDWRRPIET